MKFELSNHYDEIRKDLVWYGLDESYVRGLTKASLDDFQDRLWNFCEEDRSRIEIETFVKSLQDNQNPFK